jgi:hypothetical protein
LKLKLVALTLIAFACWLVPIKVLAQETGTPKQIEVINPPTNAPPPLSQSTTSHKVVPVRPRPTGVDSGRDYSKEEVQQLIKDYSAQYGISADLPLRVANCESGFNQFSKNRSSTASGVFQYISSTWRNTEAGKAGTLVFDADANIHMAIKSIASGGISNWSASRACWK